MKTAMQDLLEKLRGIKKDNVKYKSQFHKGLRTAFTMVEEAINEHLLELEKQQIINACNQTEFIGPDNDHPGLEYYENIFKQD